MRKRPRRRNAKAHVKKSAIQLGTSQVAASRLAKYKGGRHLHPLSLSAAPPTRNDGPLMTPLRSIGLALTVLVGLYLLTFLGLLPFWVALSVTLLSGVSLITYALDKHAARRERRRVPESSLHIIAVLGGWPGAWIAQQLLRHKTRKQPFRRWFWVTVLLHSAVMLALLYYHL